MSNRNIRQAPFWKMVFRLGGTFILVMIILRFIIRLIRTRSLKFLTESFHDGSWLSGLVYYLILGLVYGITLTLIYKNNARK